MVTTFDAWLADLWELYGDGRSLVTPVERAMAMTVAFEEARVPLVCNVDARPLAAADARDHLVRHLTSPVRFEQSVQALAAAGADTFAEVGFGGVLFGLVKRIDRGVGRACVQDRESLEAFCGAQASRREAASSVTRSEQELS